MLLGIEVYIENIYSLKVTSEKMYDYKKLKESIESILKSPTQIVEKN